MINSSNKKRIQNLDIARTFAILCVVLCHSLEVAYSNVLPYDSLGECSQMFRIILFTIGRLGVPIFLFLTGTLTLKKQIEQDEDVLKFYKKNLLPLVIVYCIWVLIYNLLEGENFDIKRTIESIFTIKPISHGGVNFMWYFPMIMGVYLAIPFLAKIVNSFSLRCISIPIVIVFIISCLSPSINVFLEIFNFERIGIITLDFYFLGGLYGLYLLTGYYINKGILRKINSFIIILISTLMFFLTISIQYYAYSKQIQFNVWYDFIGIFICSAFIFELITRIKQDRTGKVIEIITYISKISLGIYLIHMIFLDLIMKIIDGYDLNNPMETIVLFFTSFVGSIIAIYLLSKINIIKKKVFLIKE